MGRSRLMITATKSRMSSVLTDNDTSSDSLPLTITIVVKAMIVSQTYRAMSFSG